MNRRNLLKAAPASILAASLPADGFASSEAETPIMAMYRHWKTIDARVNGPVGRAMPEPEFDREVDDMLAFELKMLLTPSEDARDFVCKLFVFTGAGVLGMPDDEVAPDLWEEARALIGDEGNRKASCFS